MKYKLIVALSKDNGIGKQGNLPWKIKEDLAFFSRMTKGNGDNAVVMGRKTWDSLSGKHLHGRDNYILSSTLSCNTNISGDIVRSFRSIHDMETHIDKTNYNDVWIIGGSEIYKHYIEEDKIDTCYLTCVDESFECDTFFPDLPSGWIQVDSQELDTQQNFKVEVKKFVKS